nr:hypothetical protein [Tanacetum cinerariifolium]
MLIPDYQDIIFQDFHYFDEFECYQVIKIGRLHILQKGRKSVGKQKQKSVGKGKHKVSGDDVDFNKKKHVLPSPTGIVIREDGSGNVGARSKSLLIMGERVAGVDNIGGNKVVRTRFVVLGLRVCDNVDQQPLALANLDQQTFLTPLTSVKKLRRDVKIINYILDPKSSRFMENQ